MSPLICRTCDTERLSIENSRLVFRSQLFGFTIVNTIVTIIGFFVTNPSDVQIFAGIISLTLLWGGFPFALYSIVNENAGVLVTYIILGVCCAAAKTAMGLTVLSLVASRCESEQISFKGCYVARDVLPCLENSTCSSDILSDFNNDLPVGFSKCYAWGTNKCDNAGDVNNIGFTTFSVLQFILDVLTSCVPVYSGFLYLMRLEGSRVEELNQDNNIPLVRSVDGKGTHKNITCSLGIMDR